MLLGWCLLSLSLFYVWGGCEAILSRFLPLRLRATWRMLQAVHEMAYSAPECGYRIRLRVSIKTVVGNDRFPSYTVFRCRRATGTAPTGERTVCDQKWVVFHSAGSGRDVVHVFRPGCRWSLVSHSLVVSLRANPLDKYHPIFGLNSGRHFFLSAWRWLVWVVILL